MKTPKTRRGQVSRGKILETAAQLFHRRGVNATSVDDILDHAQMGKSQFYHYFETKEELVASVVDLQINRILDYLTPWAECMETWDDLKEWCHAYVRLSESTDKLGCPVGVIAADATPDSQMVTTRVQEAFYRWVGLLVQGLSRLKQRGVFSEAFDPESAARFAGAVIQGGLLLTRAFRDASHLESATGHFMTYLETYRAG
ncbi:MAG: TetR/AcrR family transcriptional regulator [Candidatus Eremiobacterota bacterium]